MNNQIIAYLPADNGFRHTSGPDFDVVYKIVWPEQKNVSLKEIVEMIDRGVEFSKKEQFKKQAAEAIRVKLGKAGLIISGEFIDCRVDELIGALLEGL